MKVETYLNICGVPSKVVTWGPGLAEVNTTDASHDIILMIPGNPGYTPFYDEFLQEIHIRLKCSVWIVGHAGHAVPHHFHQIIPPVTGNEALYDTKGQTLHKLSFIEQYVPTNARLHLIGHSIGAYMILQLLKVPSISLRVVGSYLLFPVFERIAESPNGSFYQNLILKFARLPVFFAQAFITLPNFLQTFLVETVGALIAIPKSYRSICQGVIHPTIIERMISLVISEFETVRNRDNEILKANKHKIKMYYGESDGWVPLEFYYQLKIELPDIDAEVCFNNYDHAFVLKHSKEVAHLVVKWIKKKQSVHVANSQKLS